MTLAYKDIKPEELLASKRIEDQRKYLFSTYLDHMFDHSTRTTIEHFTKQQTLHYLNSLAWMMIKHNIVAFQIESLQPGWLEAESQRCLYRIFVGLISGLVVGLLSGLLFGLYFGPLVGLLSGWIIAVLIGIRVGLRDNIMNEISIFGSYAS